MKRLLATVGLAAALVLSACGDDDDAGSATTAAATTAAMTTEPGPAGTTAAATFPVTVTAANGEVTLDARPERIVSLSPTATEMLFAIGAGPQVVAVDDQSTYPAEAPRGDLSGITTNIEALAAEDPDLVTVAFDPGELVAGLDALDIPVLVLPAAATLDDTYEQLELLGAATGNGGGATTVVEQMRADIDRLTAEVPARSTPLTYFHELDDTLYTATSSTFIGSVYALVGLENVADPADADASGYPQLSAEFLVAADPDLVFLADTQCCGQTPETVAARPGWDTLTAVQQGRVVPLDDDVASRWGPRVVEFLEAVVAAVAEVPAS